MSYTVALDGISLADVSPYVRIADVIELQPERTTTTRERLGAPGSIITRDHLASRQVRVQFALLSSDFTQRTAALSDIAAWAMQGKYLTISDRPGQRLKVTCTATPYTMSKRKWTELCEITFTAYDQPYWEGFVEGLTSKEQAVIHMEGAGSTWNLYPLAGNVKQVPLCLSIKPLKATLTSIEFAVNGARMAFTGLAVPAGNTFTLTYPDGYLVAKYTDADGNEVHCLANRTGDEYLPIDPRVNNAIDVWPDVQVEATYIMRGWFW